MLTTTNVENSGLAAMMYAPHPQPIAPPPSRTWDSPSATTYSVIGNPSPPLYYEYNEIPASRGPFMYPPPTGTSVLLTATPSQPTHYGQPIMAPLWPAQGPYQAQVAAQPSSYIPYHAGSSHPTTQQPARTHVTSRAPTAHWQYYAQAYPPVQEGYAPPTYPTAAPYATPIYDQDRTFYEQASTNMDHIPGLEYNVHSMYASSISDGTVRLPAQQGFALDMPPTPRAFALLPLPAVSPTSPTYDAASWALAEPQGSGLYGEQGIEASGPGCSTDTPALWGEFTSEGTPSSLSTSDGNQGDMGLMGGLLSPQGTRALVALATLSDNTCCTAGDFTAAPCYTGTYEPIGGVEPQLRSDPGADPWRDGASPNDDIFTTHLEGLPDMNVATLGDSGVYEGVQFERASPAGGPEAAAGSSLPYHDW